jgi:hypothetical protein
VVGKRGLEPRLHAPKARALTLTLHPVTSGPAESNRVSPESESGRLPSSSIPSVETPGIEPGRRCLQGMPATSAVIPMAMRRPVQPVPRCSWALFRRIATFGRPGGLPIMVLTLLMCQQTSTFTLGWCSAGIAGVEPAFRSGWSRAAYPLADP